MKILVLMVSVLVVSAMSNSGTQKLQKMTKKTVMNQCQEADWDSCLWNDQSDIKAYSLCLEKVKVCTKS